MEWAYSLRDAEDSGSDSDSLPVAPTRPLPDTLKKKAFASTGAPPTKRKAVDGQAAARLSSASSGAGRGGAATSGGRSSGDGTGRAFSSGSSVASGTTARYQSSGQPSRPAPSTAARLKPSPRAEPPTSIAPPRRRRFFPPPPLHQPRPQPQSSSPPRTHAFAVRALRPHAPHLAPPPPSRPRISLNDHRLSTTTHSTSRKPFRPLRPIPRDDLIIPPSRLPPLPQVLTSSTPNPPWLETALYGPAYSAPKESPLAAFGALRGEGEEGAVGGEEEVRWEGMGAEEYGLLRSGVESRLGKMGSLKGELPGWVGETWRRTQRV